MIPSRTVTFLFTEREAAPLLGGPHLEMVELALAEERNESYSGPDVNRGVRLLSDGDGGQLHW